MAKYLTVETFLRKAGEGIPVIDVRSPQEYEHAHIPCAMSFPIFDNEERAIVGTIYKKIGRVQAVQKGLEFVGPKLKEFTKRVLKLKSEEICVHCWRGGMRSASMAWLFETVGIKVYLLDGGYKAYRNYVLDSFTRSYQFLLLGGCTGSGKTEMLQGLQEHGEQVVDLEGLACHKGSAFGALGNSAQPSSEQFENLLSKVLLTLDIDKIIWMEDESRNIGKDFIPQAIWDNMRESSVVRIDCDYDIRVQRIMRDYACFDAEQLKLSILKIQKRLGYDKCKVALEACDNNDIISAAKICLDYYDRFYNSSLENRFAVGDKRLMSLSVDTLKMDGVIERLVELSLSK